MFDKKTVINICIFSIIIFIHAKTSICARNLVQNLRWKKLCAIIGPKISFKKGTYIFIMVFNYVFDYVYMTIKFVNFELF